MKLLIYAIIQIMNTIAYFFGSVAIYIFNVAKDNHISVFSEKPKYVLFT